MGPEVLCGRCVVKTPHYRFMRAAFEYDDVSRRLVLEDAADFIVPVPLHYRRRVKRRFNQSALLARHLAQHVPARFDPDMLYRFRGTPTQGGLTAINRRRNVQGAFRVKPAAKARLKGAHIVLIDDVLTTGSTLEACTRTLLSEGASFVDGLTLARVVRPAPLPT